MRIAHVTSLAALLLAGTSSVAAHAQTTPAPVAVAPLPDSITSDLPRNAGSFRRITFKYAEDSVVAAPKFPHSTEMLYLLRYGERAGDPRGVARAHGGLGDAHFSAGRLRTAHRHFDRAVTMAAEAGLGIDALVEEAATTAERRDLRFPAAVAPQEARSGTAG